MLRMREASQRMEKHTIMFGDVSVYIRQFSRLGVTLQMPIVEIQAQLLPMRLAPPFEAGYGHPPDAGNLRTKVRMSWPSALSDWWPDWPAVSCSSKSWGFLDRHEVVERCVMLIIHIGKIWFVSLAVWTVFFEWAASQCLKPLCQSIQAPRQTWCFSNAKQEFLLYHRLMVDVKPFSLVSPFLAMTRPVGGSDLDNQGAKSWKKKHMVHHGSLSKWESDFRKNHWKPAKCHNSSFQISPILWWFQVRSASSPSNNGAPWTAARPPWHPTYVAWPNAPLPKGLPFPFCHGDAKSWMHQLLGDTHLKLTYLIYWILIIWKYDAWSSTPKTNPKIKWHKIGQQQIVDDLHV